jgi:hypothetical protein
MIRSALFTLVLLPLAAAANGLDVAAVMKRLAAEPTSQAAFTEEKHSSLLAAPAKSSGTLLYRKPDIVEKAVTAPRAERYRIAGDKLTFTRDGKERSLTLASNPVLAAFAASLRGTLAGDERQLREHFRIAASGSEAEWKLELTPIEPEVASVVERVVVVGRGGKVATIEVREAGGDRTVTQVR